MSQTRHVRLTTHATYIVCSVVLLVCSHVRLHLHTKCLRFVERLVATYPESAPLQILSGHIFMTRRNYSYAVDFFLRAYQTDTNPASVAAAKAAAKAAGKNDQKSSAVNQQPTTEARSSAAGDEPTPVYGYQKSPQLNLFIAIASLHLALNKSTGTIDHTSHRMTSHDMTCVCSSPHHHLLSCADDV